MKKRHQSGYVPKTKPLCVGCKKPLKQHQPGVFLIVADDVEYAMNDRKWHPDSWLPKKELSWHPKCAPQGQQRGVVCVCPECNWLYCSDTPFECENEECKRKGRKGIMCKVFG